MWIRDSVQLEPYTNNFGGTKLKRKFICGYTNEKVDCHWFRLFDSMICQPGYSTARHLFVSFLEPLLIQGGIR
jgi:hypothetical protein